MIKLVIKLLMIAVVGGLASKYYISPMTDKLDQVQQILKSVSQVNGQPVPDAGQALPADQSVEKPIEAKKPEKVDDETRKKSELAVDQSMKEREVFEATYKKPTECINNQDSDIAIKCINDYVKARSAFNKRQTN